jgi:hypothetical protein
VTPTQLIALLNSLTFGDLDALRGKIEEAREGCVALAHAEIAALLAEAGSALATGDVKTYRKRVESAVARLGHLR